MHKPAPTSEPVLWLTLFKNVLNTLRKLSSVYLSATAGHTSSPCIDWRSVLHSPAICPKTPQVCRVNRIILLLPIESELLRLRTNTFDIYDFTLGCLRWEASSTGCCILLQWVHFCSIYTDFRHVLIPPFLLINKHNASQDSQLTTLNVPDFCFSIKVTLYHLSICEISSHHFRSVTTKVCGPVFWTNCLVF